MEERSYGIKSVPIEDLGDLRQNVEEMEIQGFTIIENLLTEQELNLASDKLDSVYDMQITSFGLENLMKIDEKNLVRSPLVYDDFFLTLILKPTLQKIVGHFLGDYFIINQQNGIINMPNELHHQSSWHRDLPYQDYVISKPIAIAALLCIDEFNEERGSTYVIPFSHQLANVPSKDYLNKFKYSVNAKRGSIILFNAMLYHRAGYNSSQSIRRGLNTLFTIPLIKQQINISKQLNSRFTEDPFLKRLLGYDSQIPESVDEWRTSRLERKSK